jgi:O-antigen/teichoic acid export membrane protein
LETTHGITLIKNTAHCLFNNSVGDIISFIISIWVARQLGVEQYGVFTLVLWFSSIFSWAIGMGFTHSITKFIAEHRGRNDTAVLGPIVLYVLKIELVLSGITTLVLVFLSNPIADYFFSPSESLYFFLAGLGIIPGILTAIFSSSIEGIQKFAYFTWSNIIITPFSLAAKVYVIISGKGIPGLLIVMLVFSFVNTFFYLGVMWKERIIRFGMKGSLPAELKKRIHKYNLSVMAIILCDKIIWDKSENFFLGRLCTATEIGFYNLGFNIVQRFSAILPNTFWKVLFPAMSHYSGSGDHHKTQRVFFLTTRYLAFLSFPIGIGGAILAYSLIHILYGHQFIGAQRPLQILFLASVITMTCNPGAAILYGYDRQSFIYKIGIIMAVVNIILDILLIKKFGALGAATAFAITTVTGSSIGTIYTCRIMKLKYPFASIFKIFLASIIMGIAMELIIMQNYMLWGLILAILAGSVIYLAGALALGTFEEEDLTLLKSIGKILPGKPGRMANALVGFVSEFKSGRQIR